MAVHSTEGRERIDPDAGVPTPARLEEALRLAVSDRVGATRFALWFGGNVRLGLNREGDSLVVRVPDLFFRDWIERHYTPSLIDAVEAVVGHRLRVSIQVAGECDQPPPDAPRPPSNPPEISTSQPLVAHVSAPDPRRRIQWCGLRATSAARPLANSSPRAGGNHGFIKRLDSAGIVSPAASPSRRLRHRPGQPHGTRRRRRNVANCWSNI